MAMHDSERIAVRDVTNGPAETSAFNRHDDVPLLQSLVLGGGKRGPSLRLGELPTLNNPGFGHTVFNHVKQPPDHAGLRVLLANFLLSLTISKQDRDAFRSFDQVAIY
jgi:hypothetical protein